MADHLRARILANPQQQEPLFFFGLRRVVEDLCVGIVESRNRFLERNTVLRNVTFCFSLVPGECQFHRSIVRTNMYVVNSVFGRNLTGWMRGVAAVPPKDGCADTGRDH